jgi:hypothetical protein
MKISVSSLVFFIIGIALHIQTVIAKPDDTFINRLQSTESASTLFIENRGQIGDQNGKPNPEVKYLILRPGLNIQLKKNSFSYDGYTIERIKRKERIQESMHHENDKQNDDSLVYHFHRVDIELVDANPNPQITHEGASSDYLNYYTHITAQTKGEEGVTGVRGYKKVSYHDIYPYIDLEWFLDKDGKPEYQFIIKPGGDPSRIRLKYHGAQKTELVSDAIHIHVKHGIIKEHIPLSYVQESQEKINVSFTQISENEYGFNVPILAINETLVIDPVPNRLWGTYYGGVDDDECRSLTLDNSSNVYICGNTLSLNDIASSGAWQVALDGNFEAFLAKFSTSGSRIWGTYYGGYGSEEANAVKTDASGNVYLAGDTGSYMYIASTGAWDESNTGGYDAFLVKFSSSGSRIWGTYYGGNNYDGGDALAIDASGNIYLGGYTTSTTSIASSGAWDGVFGGGTTDAFLVKFSSSGSRVWGTYYGGSANDFITGLGVDELGNVFILGDTESTNDIVSNGAWDGVCIAKDAFLVKFNSSGVRIWGTYYGGNGNDYSKTLAIDILGNVYIGGNTTSSTDIASTLSWDEIYNADNGGGYVGDGFVAKFNSSGTRIWGSYYGGSGEDRFTSIAIDASGNCYLSGSTSSTTDIASIGAWDSTFGVVTDAFLVKFSSSGSRIWGTYYGGSSWDYGSAVAVDNSGSVFLGGKTSSITEIASSGAWDGVLQASSAGVYNYDAFIVKFQSNETQISPPTLSNNSYCQNQEFTLPYTITGTYTSPNTFTAQLSDKNGSFTSPTTIGTKSSTSSGSISCTIPSTIEAGSAYRIRILSSNPAVTGSDNGSNITIHPTPQPVITGSGSTCVSEQTTSYSVPQVTGHTYSWTSIVKGNIIGSQTDNAINVRWNVQGTDTLKLRQTNSTTSCFKDTTFVVTINPSPLPKITGISSVCVDKAPETYSVDLVGGNTYQWFAPSKGTIDGGASGNSVKIRWTTQGIDTLKIRETNPQTGCIKDTFIVITIQALPLPIITGQKTTCLNSTQYDYAVSNIAGNTYEWTQPSKGNIIGSLTSNSIKVAWTSQGSDSLKVRQTNPVTGCSKDTFIVVTIQQVPNPTITGEAIVCSKNTTSTFTVDSKSGYNITWSKPKNGRIIGSNSRDSVVVEWLSSGIDTVYVRYTDAQTGCFEETKKAVLIGNPLTPSIQGSASTCIDTVPTTYRTRFQAGQSYGWSKPRLGTIIGAINLDSVQIEWNASGQDTLILREFTIATGCFKDTTLIITVNPRPQPSITGKSQVIENEQGIAYSVTSDPGSTYEWIILSGDAEITKKNGHIIELNVGDPGTVIVKVIQTTSDGCKNETQQEIVVKSIISVKEEIGKSFSVYPNPNNGQVELVVELPSTSLHEMRIELIDLLGITRYEGMIPSQISRYVIQLSDMPKGMYTIRLIMRDGVLSEKVIVE